MKVDIAQHIHMPTTETEAVMFALEHTAVNNLTGYIAKLIVQQQNITDRWQRLGVFPQVQAQLQQWQQHTPLQHLIVHDTHTVWFMHMILYRYPQVKRRTQ